MEQKKTKEKVQAMTEKEAQKVVLDLARKFCLARYMSSLESDKDNPAETTAEEGEAMRIVGEIVGKKLDDQKEDLAEFMRPPDEN